MSVFEFVSYRAYLKGMLTERRGRNRAYSMRAFAKHLGVSMSALSSVFSGKRNFSANIALQVSDHLGLSDAETEYFCALVELDKTKSPQAHGRLLRKLERLRLNRRGHRAQIALETFRAITDWYHAAILCMVDLEDADLSPKNISSALGITPSECEAALSRLCKLGLLEKEPQSENRYRRHPADSLAIESDEANEALRKFHRQMLEKASRALVEQPTQSRVVGSETFAFSKEHLKQAQEISREYLRRMVALSYLPGKKSDVYHVGIQFFSLLTKAPAAGRGDE